MNPGNFVRRVTEIVTGDSFLTEKEIPLNAFRSAVTFQTLGSPASVDTEVFTSQVPDIVQDGISFDDGEQAIVQFKIPADYAENKDQAALRLTVTPSADSSDTTDIGITTAQRIFRAGEAVDATASTAVAEDATPSTGALTREVVLDISGRGYKANDVVQLTLDANNSGTTELILNGAALIYGSTLRGYNDADNLRDIG